MNIFKDHHQQEASSSSSVSVPVVIRSSERRGEDIHDDDDDASLPTHLLDPMFYNSAASMSVSPTAKYYPPPRVVKQPINDEDEVAERERIATSMMMDEDIFEIECQDEGIGGDERNTYSYANFLKSHTCYDMIPLSSK
jgi:hypothetical protein